MKNEANLLHYDVIKDEYVFYYGKEILFKNSKNNPFLYISIEKDEVKKELPLHFCDIIKNGAYGYKIKFYNNACAVFLLINYTENRVYFKFNKNGMSGEKLNINLYKKPGKITGLGLNDRKDLNKLGASAYGKKEGKMKAADVKLAFSVKGGFAFKNCGIDDWEASFKSAITVSTRQSVGGFLLEYGKKFELSDKTEKILRKSDIKEVQKYISDVNIGGFVTEYVEDGKISNNINYLRKKGYSYFLRLSPLIREEEIEKESYDRTGLIDIGNGNYFISVKNEANMRKFSNKIRRMLDLNIDGFYIDEKNIIILKSILVQNALAYKNLNNLIIKISVEYPTKMHIYNKFNSSENCVGIYSVEYSEIKRKEEKYLRSLLFSDCDSVFYECSEREAAKLGKKGKKQILINSKKSSFFNIF